MAECFFSANFASQLIRIIHKLVGWDKTTAIWWAGACELTLHFDDPLFWVTSPFPPAHHGLTYAGPTLRGSSGVANPEVILPAFLGDDRRVAPPTERTGMWRTLTQIEPDWPQHKPSHTSYNSNMAA